nr:GNAT family N-acetyltransferase [Martelella sp. HB161492]
MLIRQAGEDDLPALIAMFAADDLGGHGDTTDAAALPDYRAAFHHIASSPYETLYVAELDGTVVGTFQTMLTRSLTGRGGKSLIIEAVQTRSDVRGHGIGGKMVAYAIDEAKRLDCRLVQLMSNAKRLDAHRFYERLGFSPSHLGFKMKLK